MTLNYMCLLFVLSFGQFSNIAFCWSAEGVETFSYRHIALLEQISIQMPPLRG